jgi:hypothetical protein
MNRARIALFPHLGRVPSEEGRWSSCWDPLREGFRELLTAPIRLAPFVDRGYRAIRIEGQIGLEAVFGAELVTNMASPRGTAIRYTRDFQGTWRSDRRAA